MDRHLRSVTIMMEATSRHTECTHFNLNLSRKPALRYNSDPAKKLYLPRCSWTAASSVKQHKPSLSPNVKTAFQLISANFSAGISLTYSVGISLTYLERISLTSAGKPHSLNVGGEGMLRPQQLPPFLPTSPLATRA